MSLSSLTHASYSLSILTAILPNHHLRLRPRPFPGNTPLHYAYAFKQMDVVALLLKHGAPPFAENRARQTPEDVMALRSKILVGARV